MDAEDGFGTGFDESYRSLVEAVGDYLIIRLSPEGLIQTWNSGAARITGFRADEVIGRPTSLFYTEEDEADGRPERALSNAALTGRFEEEAWRVRKDGKRFRAHVIIDAILDPDAQVCGFAKITRDVTPMHELERAREQLAQAQRLEIFGQLTGGIAHDFNNILTAVLGCLDLVEQSSGSEPIREVAHTGATAAVRGQKLVSQLLAFARKQVLRPQRTNVNALIDTLEPLLEKAAGERARLTLDLDPAVGDVDVDQAQFQSAILNLVLNARDAIRAEGRVRVRTRRAPGAAHAIAIEVEDDGAGMSEEVQAHAVEPFFTTKPVGQGSGLGLSQVHGFALQSGGALAIRSVLGEGTVVGMTLPAHARPAVPNQAAGSGRQSVLVVEDDPEVLKVAVSMLAVREFDILSAEDADHALDVLNAMPHVDVLFTDIVMPGRLNGIELAEKARKLYPNIEVVLTSGYPREALKDQHRLDDGMGYLSKPYRLQALNMAIDGALQRRALRRVTMAE